MKNNKSIAYSAMEVMMVFGVTCFIGMIVISNLFNVSKNIDAVKLKTAYLNFKNALDDITSNPIYYSSKDGLSDLSSIKIDTDDETKTYSGDSKFQKLMFDKLQINPQSSQGCSVMLAGKKISDESCYQSENGVIWYIPLSDFKSENMVDAMSGTGTISKYLPVTIYPDVKNTRDFNKDAVVIGVRIDGAITTVYSVDCDQEENKSFNQCKFIEYLSQAKTRY